MSESALLQLTDGEYELRRHLEIWWGFGYEFRYQADGTRTAVRRDDGRTLTGVCWCDLRRQIIDSWSEDPVDVPDEWAVRPCRPETTQPEQLMAIRSPIATDPAGAWPRSVSPPSPARLCGQRKLYGSTSRRQPVLTHPEKT